MEPLMLRPKTLITKLLVALTTAFLCSFVLVSNTHAQADTGIISLQIENDSMVGMDKYYTSGVMLSYMPLKPIPNWVQQSLDTLNLDYQLDQTQIEYSFGNAIFTPKDVENTQPQPDSRPWAGHTFASVALMRKHPSNTKNGIIGDKFELTLGVVGPASGGEQAQKALHNFIGSKDPGGWDYQIQNEVTLNLHYFLKWQYFYDLPKDLQFEFSPITSLALGSPYTYASAGFAMRVGPDLHLDYGAPTIQPNYAGSNYFAAGAPWNWYFLAGVDYRYMAYNLFLDGPLFRNGPSIGKHKDVADFFWGGAVSYNKFRTALTINYRTKEFKGQETYDVFAALNFSFYL